jgi:hypothetical protein
MQYQYPCDSRLFLTIAHTILWHLLDNFSRIIREDQGERTRAGQKSLPPPVYLALPAAKECYDNVGYDKICG